MVPVTGKSSKVDSLARGEKNPFYIGAILVAKGGIRVFYRLIHIVLQGGSDCLLNNTLIPIRLIQRLTFKPLI